MKVIKTLWIAFIISMSALFLTLPYETTSFAIQHKDDKTTATEVKHEANKTYTALKDYTIEQRDEAVAAADKKLKELDVRIEQMQIDLDNRWQDMSKAVRDKNREIMNKLNKEREVVAEWYGGMRHSSIAAWEDVKKGFADSYDRLDKAFQDAKKNFIKNN
jgi:flagellar motility protein MotE (MotC chaperone)